jgi:Cytochrome P460
VRSTDSVISLGAAAGDHALERLPLCRNRSLRHRFNHLHDSRAEEVSPIYGVTTPPGYRQWELVAPSQKAGSLDESRAVLENPIAMKDYREGTVPFPECTILAKLAGKHVPLVSLNGAYLRGIPPRFKSWSRIPKGMPQRVAGVRPLHQRPASGRSAAHATRLMQEITTSSLRITYSRMGRSLRAVVTSSAEKRGKSTLDHAHRRFRERLKLPPKFVLYSLRHTAPTVWGVEVRDPYTIMRIAAHSFDYNLTAVRAPLDRNSSEGCCAAGCGNQRASKVGAKCN